MEMPFFDSGGHYSNASGCVGKYQVGNPTIDSGTYPTGSLKMFSGIARRTFTQWYNPVAAGFRWLYRGGVSVPDFHETTFASLGAGVATSGSGKPSVNLSWGGSSWQDGPASFVLVDGRMYHCMYKFTVTDAALGGGNFGAVLTWEFYIDSVLVYSGTSPTVGASTAHPSTTGFDIFQIQNSIGGGLVGDVWVTGTPIRSGVGPAVELLGDIQIVPLFDRLDGTFIAWTPKVAGPHSDMLKEHAPDFDTTYVSTTASGAREQAFMDQVGPFTGVIKGVQSLAAIKNDIGSSAQAKLLMYNGGTTKYADGPNALFTPSASADGDPSGYRYAIDAQRKSPFTSADWGAAEVDATEFGTQLV